MRYLSALVLGFFYNIGAVVAFLPYSLLTTGISGALEALSNGRERGGKRTVQIIGSFLGYGVAMAILGTSVKVAAALPE